MTERPLLPLPNPRNIARPKGSGTGESDISFPNRSRQIKRLTPKFTQLQQAIDSDRLGSLRDDPSSIAPERALVFEVANSSSIGDFYKAVSKVPGLEFLADEELEFEPDDDFYILDKRKGAAEDQPREDKLVDGQLYIAMPSEAALRQLLSLWRQWQRDGELDRGFSSWRNIFNQLKDIRPWGPQDRISEETREDWKEEMASNPSEVIRIEAELWFYDSTNRRSKSHDDFRKVVSKAGGVVIHYSVIENIRYDAFLIDLPRSQVQALISDSSVGLAIYDDVMYLRPQALINDTSDVEEVESGDEPSDAPSEDSKPIAALLDGIPVQNHKLLAGRLSIDDPDDIGNKTQVKHRVHGTAMASLILHGDRNLQEQVLSRPLYIRPVLEFDGNNEMGFKDQLFIDVIYRAIMRIKEGGADEKTSAPSVFVINLSLGDNRRPFSNVISPWGRLLDYLSYKYKILFLVSAGNIKDPLPIANFQDGLSFENASLEDRESAVLQSLNKHKFERTLLSPAEAINPLTIGAWHKDNVNSPVGSSIPLDPFTSDGLPNISSALGLGYRKAIKPDIFFPGGHERVLTESRNDKLTIKPSQSGRLFGLKAAIPNQDKEGLISGTSAATALATRAAHQLFDVLMDKEGGSLHADMAPEYYAVVIKALLVHRARWEKNVKSIGELFGPDGPHESYQRKDNIARLLGYGIPNISEVMECANNRATLIDHGELDTEIANEYQIPLPPSLENVREPRAITITLAWFSPLNFCHQMYRMAKLEVQANTGEALAVARILSPPPTHNNPRGTIFHLRYEGEGAHQFIDNGHLNLKVFCREQAGSGSIGGSIQYGLAITIEAENQIEVYDEIRNRLRVPLALRTSP